MIEKEMEDLLWAHPDKFINEPLSQFRRQPVSGVGRAESDFQRSSRAVPCGRAEEGQAGAWCD